MEGGVPPLVLLHDALEEPVRPLQQAGALHRPLRASAEKGENDGEERGEAREKKLGPFSFHSPSVKSNFVQVFFFFFFFFFSFPLVHYTHKHRHC